MVSIIIPVFNAELFIDSCIESLLKQTYSDFEIIIVDDGSSDASLNIIDSYQLRDKRIIPIHKPGGGVSSARNLGLRIARGEFICFIDADDIVYNDYLDRLISPMVEGIDLVVGGYESDSIKYSVDEHSIMILSKDDSIKQMYRPSPYRYQGYIWDKMFRRSIIEDNHIRFDEDISFNEDRLFITRYIAAQSGKTVLDNTPIYRYYERETGAMASLKQSFNPKFYDDFVALIRMRKIIRRTFQSSELNNLTKVAILHSYVWIHNMMKQFDAFDKSLHSKMTLQLIMNTSIPFLVKAKLGL